MASFLCDACKPHDNLDYMRYRYYYHMNDKLEKLDLRFTILTTRMDNSMRASVPDFRPGTTGNKRYRTGSTFANFGGKPPRNYSGSDNFLRYIEPANTVIDDERIDEILKETGTYVRELREEAEELEALRNQVLQRHSNWRNFLNEVIQVKSPMYSHEGSIYSRKDGTKLTQKRSRRKSHMA